MIWIRSQKGTTLREYDRLAASGCHVVDHDGHVLGEYDTPDRALEVLGLIQRYITRQAVALALITGLGNLPATVIKGVEEDLRHAIVFTMPVK
jgi:hypothetical protein